MTSADTKLAAGDDQPKLYLSNLPAPKVTQDLKDILTLAPGVELTNTRLQSITDNSYTLWKLLRNFTNVTEDYATQPYEKSFNWDQLELREDMEAEWHAVAFRSTRNKANTEEESKALYDADRAANEEAVQSGGVRPLPAFLIFFSFFQHIILIQRRLLRSQLLMYWFGVPKDGKNLATCIWESEQQSKDASAGPEHTKGKGLARGAYNPFQIELYRISKSKGKRYVGIERKR